MRAPRDPNLARYVGSFGIGQGASFLGFDEEVRITNHVGAQFGVGLVGFDAGVTLHFAPGIRTHHLFVGYFQYGIGIFGSAFAGAVGGSFVFRDAGLLTMQLGLGRTVVTLKPPYHTTVTGEYEYSLRPGDPVLLISIGLCPRGR